MIAGRAQQFPAHAVQLGEIAALERRLRVGEAFVDGLEPLVDAAGAQQHVGEQREKGRAHEAGADRLLHGQAVLQLVDAFGGPAERRERRALERAAPFGFLLQLVLAGERDDLVAHAERRLRLAAIEVDALRDDEREGQRHRLALRPARVSVSRARWSARSG